MYGHSLGGAVGTLCSVDVAMQEASVVVSQMTFGSPRVGNKRFAQLFNREVDVSYRPRRRPGGSRQQRGAAGGERLQDWT